MTRRPGGHLACARCGATGNVRRSYTINSRTYALEDPKLMCARCRDRSGRTLGGGDVRAAQKRDII